MHITEAHNLLKRYADAVVQRTLASVDGRPPFDRERTKEEMLKHPIVDAETQACAQVLEAMVGLCPDCGRKVKDWQPPAAGPLAPEAWASLRDRGIDPISGHLKTCGRRR